MELDDAVLLRKQITDELRELEQRKRELESRLVQLHEVEATERSAADAAAGRTNACAREHGGPSPFKLGPIHWRQDETCSYCGSMTAARAIELLKTPGTDYSGADWKYGWPHKFYLGQKKFYSTHLQDASPEEFAEFNALSDKLLGIKWSIDPEKGLGYYCVRGVQRYGVVGEESKV